MKNTAILIAKKYLAELLLGSLLLVVWSVFEKSAVLAFEGSIFDAIFVIFLGTLLTGYIIFVCVVGAISRLFPHGEWQKSVAICVLSFFYVFVHFVLAPKNSLTVPIAVGIMAVNVAFSIIIFRSVKRGQM